MSSERPAGGTDGSRHVARLAARSSAAAVVGVVVRTLLRAGLLAVAVRWTEPTEFRQWVALAAWATVLSIGELGASAEVTRRVARGDERAVSTAVTGLAVVASVIVVGVVLLRGPLATLLVSDRSASFDWLLVMMSAAAAAQILASAWSGGLRGHQRGDIAETIRLAATVVGTTVAVTGLALGGGVGPLVVGYVTETGLLTIASVVALRHISPATSTLPSRAQLGALGAFVAVSALLALSQVSEVVDTEIDKLVLTRARPTGEVIGFTIAATVAAQARILAGVAMLPLLAATARLGLTRGGDTLWRAGTTLATTLGVALIGGVAVLSQPISSILDDGRGTSTAAAMLGCCVAAAANLVGAGPAYRAVADGRYGATAASSTLNIAVNGAIALTLTPRFGLPAAVAGSIAANAFATTLLLTRLAGDGRYRYDVVPVAAIAGTACGTVALAHLVGGSIASVAGGVALVAATAAVIRWRCWQASVEIAHALRPRWARPAVSDRPSR